MSTSQTKKPEAKSFTPPTPPPPHPKVSASAASPDPSPKSDPTQKHSGLIGKTYRHKEGGEGVVIVGYDSNTNEFITNDGHPSMNGRVDADQFLRDCVEK